MKKYVAAFLALVMLVSLTACQNKKAATAAPTALSDATSAEAGYYRLTAGDGSKTVVNKYGDTVVGYGFDAEGNIIGQDASVVVAAANVAEYIPVTSVSFTSGDQTVEPGAVISLNVEVQPADATCKDVQMVSSDAAVVSVTAEKNGMANAGGQTTITAKTYNGSLTATCVITVAATETAAQEAAAPAAPATNGSTGQSTTSSSQGSSSHQTAPAPSNSGPSGSAGSSSGSGGSVTTTNGSQVQIIDPSEIPADAVGGNTASSLNCSAAEAEAESYVANTYGWVIDHSTGGRSVSSAITTTSYSELVQAAKSRIDVFNAQVGAPAGTHFRYSITNAGDNIYGIVCAVND